MTRIRLAWMLIVLLFSAAPHSVLSSSTLAAVVAQHEACCGDDDCCCSEGGCEAVQSDAARPDSSTSCQACTCSLSHDVVLPPARFSGVCVTRALFIAILLQAEPNRPVRQILAVRLNAFARGPSGFADNPDLFSLPPPTIA